MSQRPLFCIIDASSFIFRAYYAVRPLSNKAGVPTNAVFGFAQMILKVLQDFRPAYIAVVYDTKHPSFRKELYPDYKANRGTMPEDLVPQIPYIKKLVEVLGLPGFERAGFEADDVIATLAHQAAERSGEADVCIISSDKDLMQLVDRHVYLYDTMKDLKVDEAGVKEKLGVPPPLVADYLGIVGDSSDNIPGVRGVGPKGAVSLLEEFGSLENVYANLPAVKKDAIRAKLEESRDTALLSKRLATVRRDLDVALDWHSLKPRPRNEADVRALLEELDFQQLLKRLESPTDAPALAAPPTDDRVAALGAVYRAVTSLPDLKDALARLESAPVVAFDTETDSLHTRDDCLVGVSLCGSETEAFYIPLRHKGAAQSDFAQALPVLADFLRRKKVVGQNLKFDMNVFRAAGERLPAPHFDTMVASYVLDAEDRHGLDHLAEKYFSHRNISYEEVCGSGKQAVP
ncbi:MAG: DNA polymerase I, partial [Bdellovibrionales bacterium]|nr:DNA polymerase I [Bdellovibrionales bacterium]